MDADRLESAGRGIALRTWAETRSTADDCRKLGGTLDWSGGNYGPGDCASARLLAIVTQNPSDLGLVGRIEEFGRGQARLAHPHIERAVSLEGESAISAIEL